MIINWGKIMILSDAWFEDADIVQLKEVCCYENDLSDNYRIVIILNLYM